MVAATSAWNLPDVPARLVDSGAERQRHVEAGVAIGHREDVEGVDRLNVPIEPAGACNERRQEPVTIECYGLGRSLG